MSIGMNITNTIDLHKPLEVHRLATLLGADDYKANSFILTIVDNGAPVALDGYSVMAVLVRADGYGVAMAGSIEGNVVRVTLDGACYNVSGSCYIVIKLHNGEETRTIYKATAYVDETDGVGFVDENVHSTFDALVESIIAKYLEENPVAGGGIKVETDPTVPEWAKQASPPTYTAADVGLGNVDNVRQYSEYNQPPYPVKSVNGMTGDVIIEVKGGDGGIAVEVDPTVPAWAKQPTKPTYTAAEVGALALDTLYRVGDIYITTNSTSPAEIFGGTWERIEDRFLLAAGSAYAAGSTGGEAAHTLTVDEMPSHYHLAGVVKSGKAGTDYVHPVTAGIGADSTIQREFLSRTSDAGGGQAHNNMPPYLAVYVWRRVA